MNWKMIDAMPSYVIKKESDQQTKAADNLNMMVSDKEFEVKLKS